MNGSQTSKSKSRGELPSGVGNRRRHDAKCRVSAPGGRPPHKLVDMRAPRRRVRRCDRERATRRRTSRGLLERTIDLAENDSRRRSERYHVDFRATFKRRTSLAHATPHPPGRSTNSPTHFIYFFTMPRWFLVAILALTCAQCTSVEGKTLKIGMMPYTFEPVSPPPAPLSNSQSPAGNPRSRPAQSPTSPHPFPSRNADRPLRPDKATSEPRAAHRRSLQALLGNRDQGRLRLRPASSCPSWNT